MSTLEVGNLKSLRESLCVAQSGIGHTYATNHPTFIQPDTIETAYAMSHIRRIQEVIDQIDILRPLGPDGKHGDRHTEHCGCEDKPYRVFDGGNR